MHVSYSKKFLKQLADLQLDIRIKVEQRVICI